MSRTRNSVWNIAGGLLFTLVSVACGLLATPWLLRWLGVERFGAFKVLTDWIGYLTALDLGLGGALLACLASKVGVGDARAVRAVLAAGRRAYLGVAALTLAAGIALILFFPFVVHVHHLGVDELRSAAAVALLPVLMTPLLVFRSLAEARQRTYLLSLLMTVQSLLTTCLCLLTAWAGWGLVGQSLAVVSAQTPVFAALTYDGVRAFGKIHPSAADALALKALASLRRPSFIHGLADRIGMLSDNIIVAWFLGSRFVTPFFLTQQLAMLAQFQLRGVSNAVWAGLVELYARGQKEQFRRRLIELTGIVSGLGAAILGPIAAYNHHFVLLWVGPAGDAGELTTLLACLNAWLWALFSLWSWPLLGAGYIGRWAPYSLTFILVNLSVSVWAVNVFGIAGPLIGTAAGFLLIDAWAMPNVMHQVFDLSALGLWRTALAPLRWGLPYAALLWWEAHAHHPVGWVGLGAEMTLATVGGLALWQQLDLSSEIRLEWRRRLQNFLRKP